MKNLATLILISLPVFCNAQTIHFDDRTSPYCLYHNYDNVVTVLPSAGMDLNELKFTCINCEMARDTTTSNDRYVYNLTPIKYLREAQFQIHDKNGLLLNQEDFRVSNPPAFELFIGSKGNGEMINKANVKLSVGYHEEVTLIPNQEIISWEIEIDGKAYSGKGTDFTEEAMQAIIATDSSKTIRIICNVLDRSSEILHHIPAEFKVG